MHATSALQRPSVAARLLTPRNLALVVAVVLVALYLGVRAVGAERPRIDSPDLFAWGIFPWTVLAALLALISPRAGLLVLIAIGPFEDPAIVRRVFVGEFNISDVIRAKAVIAIALVAGAALRLLLSRSLTRRARPASAEAESEAESEAETPHATAWSGRRSATTGWASRLEQLGHPAFVLGLAALLVVGTGISLFAVSVNVDETFARQSIGVWVGGIVTPFAAMFVAAWLARRGDLGVLPVLVVAASVAGVMGLIDHLSKGAFDGTGLAWTIEEGIKGERRLSGVPGLPNAAATMLLAPTILLGTAALGLRDRRLRVAAALGSVVALGILALTFSRSAFLALVAVAIVVAWRRDRRVGMLVAAASIVLVLVLLPQIVGQRGDAGGDAGLVTSGDDDRVRSWTAAFRMWLDAPLTGHGFQSFRLLHGLFGEPEISAPHNEWLRFFAEEGVFLGIAGLALIGIGSLALARERGWLATGILGVFIGYVIMASFNNPLTYGQVGLMVFPVVGTGLGLALARRARRDPVLAPSPRVAGPPAPEAPNAPAGSPSRGSSEA